MMKIPKNRQKIQRKFLFLRDPLNNERQILPVLTRIFVIGVNLLKNTPKILNFNKGDIFQIIYEKSDEEIW